MSFKFFSDDTHIRYPTFKLLSTWLATLGSSMWAVFSNVPWEVLAQFAAFLYSCTLLYEWVVKRIRRSRNKEDDDGTDSLLG